MEQERFPLAHFVLCFFITIGEGYDLFIYGSVLPAISAEWGLSASSAGLIGSSGMLGIAIGSIGFGRLADRLDRKKTLLICIMLLSGFTVACGFAKFLKAVKRFPLEWRPSRVRLMDVGKRRNHFLFWIACFMTMILIFGLATWLPELMLRSGKSLYSSLGFPIFLNVGSIAGTILFVFLARRGMEARRLLIVLYFIGAISICAFAGPFPLAILHLVVMVTGACTYGVQNIVNAYVSGYYPEEVRSTGLGLCLGWGRIGAVAGSALWGILLEFELPVQMTFLIFSFPAILGGLAFSAIGERSERR
ncbi:MAG: MFS transporter [Clostridiales Family XIII bacterium]|jgi:AAHS family benzoate transporter-like MFS transporter|nr:MFS transporter [Clostridiales Family XIII bacterium]